MDSEECLSRMFVILLVNAWCVLFWILFAISLFHFGKVFFGVLCLGISLVRLWGALKITRDLSMALVTGDWYLWKRR